MLTTFFTPIVRHQSAADFLRCHEFAGCPVSAFDAQVAMYEALATGYSPRFMPGWLVALQQAVQGDYYAAEQLALGAPELLAFATAYRARAEEDYQEYYGRLWAFSHEDQCAAEAYYYGAGDEREAA